MRRIGAVLALALALALAGCIGGDGGGSATAETGTDSTPSSSSGAGGGASDDGLPDGTNATPQEPPDWEAGDWWTVKLDDPNSGETFTVRQVVAGQHGSKYDVGLAKEDFADEVVIAHQPGLGELEASTLGYQIHGIAFQPLKFPLEKGQTWTTKVGYDAEYDAEVVEVAGTKAHVVMTYTTEGTFGSFTDYVNLTYDAAVGNIVKLTIDDELSYEVTDSGTGHEGDVVVPHGREQVFVGRIAGALGPGGPIFGLGPATPTQSADVPKPDASVALFAGSGTLDGNPLPGVYRETAAAPGGTTFSHEVTGAEPITIEYAHARDVSGTWSFEHVAGGFGIAATEIISYDQLEVTLGGNATDTAS